jgi:hypothetical protein
VFDELVVPLAKARRSAEAPPYFPLRQEASATSYFGPPSLKVMSPADFELHLGDKSADLLDALGAYWAKHGDTGLTALVPRLKELAVALDEEAAEHDGKVDVLCYTLF